MNILPVIKLLIHDPQGYLAPLRDYLQQMRHLSMTTAVSLPDDLSPYQVILSSQPHALAPDPIAQFVQAGGGLMGFATAETDTVPELFGAQPETIGQKAELRVLFTDQSDPLRTRLTDAFYVQGHYRPLRVTAEQTTVTLYADWCYTHQPMLTARRVGEGTAVLTTLQHLGHVVLRQVLYRLIRQLAHQPNAGQTLGVGILGYAPSVGQLHGAGAAVTDGLAIRAACDLSQARLAQARADFPDIALYESAEKMAASDDVDVVIIATPPNSHAKLSMQMLEMGKHVICEKPLAFNRAETAEMMATAERVQRHLSCHQNRRWDVDYLAIKQAVGEGLIGDLFYLEMFVGDFNHPCGFWHSHEAVSGGTTYDWGAHYLDWMVGLIDDRITEVICTRQNRLWHDVTNADQERIQVRFAGGQEVEFIHSDIAAVRKPKWYVLGTEGGIVGEWHDHTSYDIDPLLYFQRHDIPATEMPPKLTLRRRHASGQMVAQEVAVPPRVPYSFHRNLADHLLTGEPITVPVAQSARVVAVLEAAMRSAEKGGSVERVDDEG